MIEYAVELQHILTFILTVTMWAAVTFFILGAVVFDFRSIATNRVWNAFGVFALIAISCLVAKLSVYLFIASVPA